MPGFRGMPVAELPWVYFLVEPVGYVGSHSAQNLPVLGCGLQAAESRRYRWHSLACAFEPMP
ncbi:MULTISPECIES: hypothetical protein [unclassified Ensifer]|uniref:hypothetical protein n=1 Tax=Ensifer TaxID=106591 RepID=UPI0007099878|nr:MULTISPECIES: hypothetical protein [unclassified Ensifer]